MVDKRRVILTMIGVVGGKNGLKKGSEVRPDTKKDDRMKAYHM